MKKLQEKTLQKFLKEKEKEVKTIQILKNRIRIVRFLKKLCYPIDKQ